MVRKKKMKLSIEFVSSNLCKKLVGLMNHSKNKAMAMHFVKQFNNSKYIGGK